MNSGGSVQVLQLYRRLLKYGNQLQYTDKNYFRNRIRVEFRQNKELQDPEKIEFEVKVSRQGVKAISKITLNL